MNGVIWRICKILVLNWVNFIIICFKKKVLAFKYGIYFNLIKGLALVDKFVYAIGGWNGDRRLSSVERNIN